MVPSHGRIQAVGSLRGTCQASCGSSLEPSPRHLHVPKGLALLRVASSMGVLMRPFRSLSMAES